MADGTCTGRGRRLVIGIGNEDRGDDAVGHLTARLLASRLPRDVEVLEHNGEATGLLEHLASAEAIYLIDAAVSGTAAGSIRRFDCRESPLPSGDFAVSTHGLGPAEAIELARALGQLPRHCIVFAIEAAGVDPGEPLTGALRAAAERVAAQIAAELSARSG